MCYLVTPPTPISIVYKFAERLSVYHCSDPNRSFAILYSIVLAYHKQAMNATLCLYVHIDSQSMCIWYNSHDDWLHTVSLRWRHNDLDGVSNDQPHGCLLNRLFRRRSKKTSKLRVTGLCVGNSPGPVNSPHKGPVTRKRFPFDDVIMVSFLIKYFGTTTICIIPNLDQRKEWVAWHGRRVNDRFLTPRTAFKHQ